MKWNRKEKRQDEGGSKLQEIIAFITQFQTIDDT